MRADYSRRVGQRPASIPLLATRKALRAPKQVSSAITVGARAHKLFLQRIVRAATVGTVRLCQDCSRITAGRSPLNVIVSDLPRTLSAARFKPIKLPVFMSKIEGRSTQNAPGPRTPLMTEQATLIPPHTAPKLMRVGVVGSSPRSLIVAGSTSSSKYSRSGPARPTYPATTIV